MASALLLLSGQALSQSNNPIEEVVVTATKRGASVQDIPAAISSVGGDDLERRGVDGVEGLSLQVPNLTYGSNGIGTFVTIRGVGTTVDSGVAEPSVATYVDGVFLPRATMGSLRQVDLNRVEVLRGPQGTLYGRNATAGAMNFVSRAPSREFEGQVNLSTGSRDAWGVSGYVSGPLAEGVYGRLSGGHEKQDGYVKISPSGRKIADTDVRYARGALLLEPTDTLSVDLAVKYEESDAAKAFQQLLTPAGTLPAAGQTTEQNRIVADGPFSTPSDTTIVSATVNWDFSDTVSFRSVTGYVDHSSETTFDADSTDAAFLVLDKSRAPSESVSQEFNLIGESARLKWLVGAYFYKENYLLDFPAAFPSGVPGLLPPGAVNRSTLKERTESYALFTDFTYSLTDRLDVIGGFRFNAEEKEFNWSSGAEIPGVGFMGQENVRSSSDTDDFLPKIGLQYYLNDNVNLYAQAQKGIKSGGHQLSAPATFEGEEITAYEVGMKSTALDQRLTANVAAFKYDYQDLQITNVIPPSTTLVENADAEIQGLEVELFYEANANLRFNAGFSLLDSEYTEFVSLDQAHPERGDQDLSGQELVRAPEYSMNVGAEWYVPVASSYVGGVSFRGDVYHSDDVVMRYFGTEEDTQEAYTVANFSVTLMSPAETIQLRLFLDNVTDEDYLLQDTYVATFGAYMGIYAEPRNWGAELSYRF